jgi:poly(A) polymerase
MREQAKTVAVHKRFALVIYEIWENQPRLIGAVHQRRALRLLNQQRFRAAYDFLLLRAAADPDLQDAAAWWTQLVEADPAQREVLFQPAGPKRKKRKPRKKRRPDEATQESPPPEAGESPGD